MSDNIVRNKKELRMVFVVPSHISTGFWYCYKVSVYLKEPSLFNRTINSNSNNVYKSVSLVDFIKQQQADMGNHGQLTQEKLQDLLTTHLVQQFLQMRQSTNEQTKPADLVEDVHNANKTAAEVSLKDNVKKVELPDSLDNATKLLNEYQLDESEHMFLRLHQQALCSPDDQRQSLVNVLVNLAEICLRRSRRCRDNPMEKQWLYTHTIALLQNASEICDKAIRGEDGETCDTAWFEQQQLSISTKLRPVEDNQSRILYNWLKNEEKMIETLRPLFASTPSIQTKNFPLTPSMPRQNLFPGMPCFVSNEAKSDKDNFAERLRWLTKFWRYCRDRLHNKNFKEIVERLSEKVEEEMNNFESPISPVNENNNNEKEFEDVFYLDVEEVRDIGNIKELSDVNSPVRQYSLSYELASSDVNVEGWDFFLEERKNYKFDTVIQMSPHVKSQNNDCEFIIDTELSDEKQRLADMSELISPLHEHSISLTIVRSLIKLAERLAKEEDFTKAEALYEQIYIILFEIQDSSVSVMKLKANVMKNLGMLKCKLSKGEVGLKMLKKGLQMCRELGEDGVNSEVSVLMFELGNGYIVEKWNDESFFDNIIAVIAESFEKEFSDPDNETSSSQTSQTENNNESMNESTKMDDKNVKEAMSCFEEAISILDEIPQRDEKQTDVLAKSYLKLGDCHFMMKEFNEALICFEKSWTLFNSRGQSAGRALFLENAHVLLMLGVSSFMLHVYPRTVSVFELAYRMLRYAYGLSGQNFFVGLILSLLGITYYKLKYYHKCVSVCFQAFEIFSNLYQNTLSTLPKHKFWLVCQTLYVLGNSYNVLNLQHKAIKYLSLGRSLMLSTDSADKRQHMRILQILGDCYFAQYDYKTSLDFYNEALILADDKDNQEDFDPNQSSEDMALHNQLLSRSADAHISMRQYQNAVHYLEQARDIQDILQEDIKGDLVSTLKQLGQMHSVAGDVEKAIESYNECIEIYKEIHGKLEPEMCETLGNLATMCYVKACICEDIEQELEMILRAEQCFQDALTMEMNHCVCVKYANFLYSQGNYDDAILYLEDCLKLQIPFPNIVYGGLEKVTLPELLQEEVDAQEEVVLPASSLAYYLLILCNRLMNCADGAEKYILLLMEEAYLFQDPLLHSLLGYSLMELSLYEEAALSFFEAAIMQPEYFLAMDNYCICLCLLVLTTLQRAIITMLKSAGVEFEEYSYDCISPFSNCQLTPNYLELSDTELQDIFN
ncbi:uncharacterized protein LOC106878778 isoform X2 [Octopus bimaculoides]|uniref:uncharacterized protein LOC106878778 isoform X2 n=1 Tax=Octopus bimaculoides TaxID=37653 RepID=UPI0022E41905|nr:uncharacterized protein LOC106878778 isoform X2 [Octopus bimaculoides]